MNPMFAEIGLITKGDARAWAVTTPDDAFRYVLARTWDFTLPRWVYCMLNPSKARHDVPDPTLGKCVGFASRSGAGGVIIVNFFSYSATDPADMVRAAAAGVDVVGEHNNVILRWASTPTLAIRRIAAWGRVPAKLSARVSTSRTTWELTDPDCFGLNGDGSPKHPLMLGYATPLVRLTDARAAMAVGTSA